jgi:glycerol uptake facilitator protein
MSPFLSEFTGTALLVTLGDGVVANTLLYKSKGNNGGLIAITFGWAVAVFVGVFVAAKTSGAHLNPAVTIALACMNKFSWGLVPVYLAAQLTGAMAGASLVWLAYKQHFDQTTDQSTQLMVFCTAPSIRSAFFNFITELVSTFIFILALLYIVSPSNSLGALDALPVALLVLGIGLSLGGPTGYAINPARDLGPRIMHALLPIKNKGGSDWRYSWVPVLAPILGGLIAVLVYKASN